MTGMFVGNWYLGIGWNTSIMGFVALSHFIHPRPTVEVISTVNKACVEIYFGLHVKAYVAKQ